MKLRQYQIDAKAKVLATELGQVILPTGTGKSIIQGVVIEELMKNLGEFGIFVILTPRILLTNQLMRNVGDHLIKSGVQIRTLTIHSGASATFVDEDSDDEERYIAANLGMVRTTSYQDVIAAFVDANEVKRPLLVCCTYDSVPTLTAALRESDCFANQVLCDEAHYIVEKGYHKNISGLKEYTARMHFFTATQRTTVGADGNGMNNEKFYGKVEYRATPREMIDQGYMVRPRIHYEKARAGAPWSEMVKDAFELHQSQVGYNAKMLVCCNGTKTLQEINNSESMKNWAAEEKVTVFAISSAHGPMIDRKPTTRDEFLKKLREHTGKAIILHIGILTEGIDVPDITGVMFIRNMGTTRFLQSLGRATRVLAEDSGKATDNFEENSKNWKKPYAWVIISEKDDENEGKTADLESIIRALRMAGFEAKEEVVIAIDRGEGTPVEFKPCNAKKGDVSTTFAKFFDIEHELEIERLAALEEDRKMQLSLLNEADLNLACPI